MKKILNNIQLVFIIILAIALILSFLFRPSKPINTYESEINQLQTINKELRLSNDSLTSANNKLQKEINTIPFDEATSSAESRGFFYTKIYKMATDKKGFVLYADQKELFEHLPNEKAGELIKHIFKYVNDENPITEDLIINLAFTSIKQNLLMHVFYGPALTIRTSARTIHLASRARLRRSAPRTPRDFQSSPPANSTALLPRDLSPDKKRESIISPQSELQAHQQPTPHS